MCALLIGKAPDRIPLYFENCELYEVTPTFLQRVWNLDLYRKFDSLKGADLLYACIAHIEQIPLGPKIVSLIGAREP
jgi:hypothetical protein